MVKRIRVETDAKLVYVRALEARLEQKKAQLAFVKRKVRRAAESGRIEISDHLRNAEKSADSALSKAYDQLQRLKAADDESWADLKPVFDMAWEEVSESIKKIVARFS